MKYMQLFHQKLATMKPRISFEDAPKGFMDGLLKTGSYIRKSGLDQKLLELVHYRASQINGCAYCLDMHHKDAIHLGETELRLHSLAAWKETPYYTDQEKAVLAYTEAVTNGTVEDKVFEALTPFFSKSQIADLTLAVATVNSWNRLNIAFRTIPGNYQVGQFD
jgi:AhpD family alkylhydroperoxidase